MRFTKLLYYDFKNGFLIGWSKFLLLLVLIIAYCFDFYLRKSNAYIFDEIIPQATWIDYVFHVFAGEKEYVPSLTEPFVFPVKWLLFHLFILYSTLYYPSRDLSTLGLNILVRTKGRFSWWISKVSWNVCYVLALYIVTFTTVGMFCLIIGEPLSFNLTSMFINDIFNASSPYESYSNKLVSSILLLPLIISIGLNLVQMTLALFVKPLYSFGLMAVMLLASTYYLHSYLPGNYAMLIRSEHVVENGVTFFGGMITSVILIAIAVFVGSLYFKRYDILDMD